MLLRLLTPQESSMPAIGELLAEALRHHQGGHLGQAEALYRQILEMEPRQADAWHLLGLVAEHVGRLDLASQYIGQALHLHPGYAEAYCSLGNILWSQGRLQRSYCQVLCSEETGIRRRPATLRQQMPFPGEGKPTAPVR